VRSFYIFSAEKITRGEKFYTGVKGKELFPIMVNFFPQELRDSFITTLLE
jgi:hypothetical protein